MEIDEKQAEVTVKEIVEAHVIRKLADEPDFNCAAANRVILISKIPQAHTISRTRQWNSWIVGGICHLSSSKMSRSCSCVSVGTL